MNVSYKQDKSPVGLSGKWAIPLGNYHVDCFVWVDKDALLANVGHTDEDFVAAYVHYPWRKRVGGLFGEIHIMETEVTPGNVAHEIEHALLDYTQHVMGHNKTGNMLNEFICKLMETMTEIYWREYFGVFTSQETSPEVESSADEVSAVENQPAEPESPPTSLDDDRRNEEAQRW